MTARGGPGVSLARTRSRRGVCSRARGEALGREGRERVGGCVVRDPAQRVDPARDALAVDGAGDDAA